MRHLLIFFRYHSLTILPLLFLTFRFAQHVSSGPSWSMPYFFLASTATTFCPFGVIFLV